MTDVDSRPPNAVGHRRKNLWMTIAVVLVIISGISLALFQPWRIFTRSSVDEALPVAAAAQIGSSSAMLSVSTSSPATAAEITTSEAVAPQAMISPVTEASANVQVPAPGVSGGSAASGSATDPAPSAEDNTADGAAPEGGSREQVPVDTEPTVVASGAFVDGEHSTSGTASILQLPDGSRFVRLEGFSTSDGPDVDVWITDQQAGGDDWGKYDDGRYLALGDLKGTEGNQNYPIPAEADLSGLTSVVIWCDRFNVAFGTAAVAL